MPDDPNKPMERDQPAKWAAVRRRLARGLVGIFLLLIIAGVAWTWIALQYSYSTGERVGYIQKISKKGWVCKTWEGELAMLNQPGVPPQIFNFSVRDEGVAQNILIYAAPGESYLRTASRRANELFWRDGILHLEC
jgi:hypothetical protein